MGKAKSAIESQERALKEALEFVNQVRVKLEALHLELKGAYLIGSRARGDFTEESDVDLVLVVDNIDGLNKIERLSLIKDELKPKMDVLLYSTREWESETSLWIKELKKEAKLLT